MGEKRTYKLLNKASINFLLMSATLLILSAVALFIYTRTLLDEETEEELYIQLSYIEQNIKDGGNPSNINPIISIEKVNEVKPITVRDTLIFVSNQDELELFRELSKTIQSEEDLIQIKVRVLVIESEDIVFGIVFSFISILVVAFFILFFIDKSRNEKLWKPFFKSLDTLKDFSFENKEPISFESSNIEEFNNLNNGLNELILKIRNDYNNLKQFTEDVSHEAQTPLAIMQAKIENIINQENILETQYEELTSIQKDIKRLSQLNSRLILLAKIDNDQFAKTERIDFATLINERIEDFKDISENKFEVEINENATVIMDSFLAETLINNLLSNAIKYSTPNSIIYIKASSMMLQVSNSGANALKNPQKVFERFYRESSNKKATGLGLSIVSKICDYYGFTSSYQFREIEKQHVFRIDL